MLFLNVARFAMYCISICIALLTSETILLFITIFIGTFIVNEYLRQLQCNTLCSEKFNRKKGIFK